MTADKQEKIIIAVMPVLLVIIIVVVIKKVFDTIGNAAHSIGEGAGLLDSKTDQKNITAQAKAVKKINDLSPEKNPFDISYWKNKQIAAHKSGKIVQLISDSSARDIAKTIYDSFGYLSVNPARVESVIRALGTQTQISYLSYTFSQKYGVSLWRFLEKKMYAETSDKIMDRSVMPVTFGRIITYVQSLPDGIRNPVTPTERAAAAIGKAAAMGRGTLLGA